ncbi:hypothetical protein [Neobacillus mesonae]|uniref:hypothetical protein n=1 Tax=Neobacillus mesonae TaxID=1193713 RepID=UPI0025727605|nr:hypothetical protein [Neobacillus mesonae]MED4202447.1 hypothetical protein [Neobacillus mesonae]
MARGEHFNHKNKNHPGNFPKHGRPAIKTSKEEFGDEEFLVTREAFKNRVEEEEMRGDTARLLPKQKD